MTVAPSSGIVWLELVATHDLKPQERFVIREKIRRPSWFRSNPLQIHKIDREFERQFFRRIEDAQPSARKAFIFRAAMDVFDDHRLIDGMNCGKPNTTTCSDVYNLMCATAFNHVVDKPLSMSDQEPNVFYVVGDEGLSAVVLRWITRKGWDISARLICNDFPKKLLFPQGSRIYSVS